MELIEITEHGEPAKPINNLLSMAKEAMNSTALMYTHVGYSPPWIGYLAVENGRCVGTCVFKASPENNRVEIAYFTFPENEGRGVATRMARSLVYIAVRVSPEITITAQTLPEENASTAVLKKNGFQLIAELEHPEYGKVWEWHLVNS